MVQLMEKRFDFGALLQKHAKQHKNKPTQFVSVAGGVRKRFESSLSSRKSSRLTIFDSIRNLPKVESVKKQPEQLTKEELRRIQLNKWKEEKEKRKKEAAAQKKKPFLVGVARSPLKSVPLPPPPKILPSTSGRVTRSQHAKNNQSVTKPQQFKVESFAPKNAVFKAPEIKTMNSKVKIQLKKNGKGKEVENLIVQCPPSKTKNKQSNLRTKTKLIKVTPIKHIPKSESSSEEKLRSPKSPVEVPLTPEQIVEEAKANSPYVTISRGKANARRETKKKIAEGLLDEDASHVDSVHHFKRQLNSEIKRMTEMCDTWESISQQMVLPEAVQDAVLGAVGQARLLMSHKLQQFATLVQRCERPEPGGELVTPADLHGFWDVVFMQVVNVDVRFKKLEEMRARNWAEEAPVAPRRRAAPKAKPVDKPAAASRLRDVIAAARKAKKQDGLPQERQDVASESSPPAKTFEAGFFFIRSPVRSLATPATPNRSSLLKAVLSSEAKKSATKHATSLAMLRASLIGKNIEHESPLAQPLPNLTPINLQATPGRSILKPVNVASSKKSIKVVLFDDSDGETLTTSHKDSACEGVVNGVKELDITTDSTVTTTPSNQKENKTRKKSLTRQNAIEKSSPVMTRSRRKSLLQELQ